MRAQAVLQGACNGADERYCQATAEQQSRNKGYNKEYTNKPLNSGRLARQEVDIEEDEGTKGKGLSNKEGRRGDAKSEVEEDNDKGKGKGTQLNDNHTEERHDGERGNLIQQL